MLIFFLGAVEAIVRTVSQNNFRRVTPAVKDVLDARTGRSILSEQLSLVNLYAQWPISTKNFTDNGTIMTNPVSVYVAFVGDTSASDASYIIDLINSLSFSRYNNTPNYLNTLTSYFNSQSQSYAANGIFTTQNFTVIDYVIITNLTTCALTNWDDSKLSCIDHIQKTFSSFEEDPDTVLIVMLSSSAIISNNFLDKAPCGEHSYYYYPSKPTILYKFIITYPQNVANCAPPIVPLYLPTLYKYYYQVMASVVAHELAEVVTDPDLKNGFYMNSVKYENSDICAYYYGDSSEITMSRSDSALNFSAYNFRSETGNIYLIQSLLDLRTRTCVTYT